MLSGGTQHRAFPLNTRAKKGKYKCKQIFLLLERGSDPQPVDLQAYFVPLAPRLASMIIYYFTITITEAQSTTAEDSN